MSTYTIKKVPRLPEWKKELYPTIPLVGTNFKKAIDLEPQGYTYKIPLSRKDILETEVKIVKLELEKGKPVKISFSLNESAQNTHIDAIPCVLLIGEDFHEFEYWDKIFASIGLMGHPLEFAMGSATQAAEIEFTPNHNEVVRVAFWVLRGPLEPLPEPKKNERKAGEPKKADNKPKKFMGMDLEAMATDPVNIFIGALKNESFYRAWLGHNYETEKDPKWKSAPLECTITPGKESSPNYTDIIPTLQKQHGIESITFCEFNENQTRWLKATTRVDKTLEQIHNKLDAVKSQNIDLTESPVFPIRIKTFTEHPSLYVSLLSYARKYQKWSENEIRASFIINEIAEASSMLEVLEQDASKYLSSYLAHVSAFDAIIVTKDGLVTASSSTNFQLTIWEDSSWAVLEENSEGNGEEILISEPQREPILECNYVVAAIPLSDEKNVLLGWVMMKIAIGK